MPSSSSTSPATSNTARLRRGAGKNFTSISIRLHPNLGRSLQSDMNLDTHDKFVSIGRHLGKKECRAPLAGRAWLPVGVPCRARTLHHPNPDQPGDVWTTSPLVRLSRSNTTACGTATNRRSSPSSSISLAGQKKTRKSPPISIRGPGDAANFLESGWRLIDARPLNTPWQRYRDYLAQSGANSAWPKRLCPLALRLVQRPQRLLSRPGRPVILQETGWTTSNPHGEGLPRLPRRGKRPRRPRNRRQRPRQNTPAPRAGSRKHIAPRPSS